MTKAKIINIITPITIKVSAKLKYLMLIFKYRVES